MTKILVIEDEEFVRENLIDLLDAEEFETFSADNGKDGVAIATQEIPDLILCDVMMPELDGFGTLELLRQNSATETIPFIFLTAKVAKIDFRQGMELGADDYLTKPFTRAELLGAISAQLQKKARVQAKYESELQQAEAKLDYLMHHDPVTGLTNRLSLRDRFEKIRDTAPLDAENKPIIPVLYLSLDRFERLQKSLGHACQSTLLKEVSERLCACIKEGDTVAYLSDREFAILLATATQRQDALRVAQAIRKELDRPFLVSETQTEVFLSASIGISLYPHNGQDIDTLLHQANAAREYVVAKGGNGYHLYTVSLQVTTGDDLSLESHLRRAIERNELQAYYQPRIDLKTGEIVGTEALARWIHPEKGFISPAKFIPIAEETGLIVPIGEWMLKTACAQAHQWHQQYNKPLVMAVNLSSRQFMLPDLCQRLVRIFSETQLNSRYLELELTESVLVQNPNLARQNIIALKNLGITIAIDDFGTGYSSLNYLHSFNFDILKIDRCFVSDLTDNPQNAAIVKAIVEMSHSLGLTTIAEGVETAQELACLQEYTCDQMQGYLFSPPVNAEAFGELLAQDKRLPMLASV
ncbi:MAG: EAL domain-containing protein [Spirulinaceae cyanobacterium]